MMFNEEHARHTLEAAHAAWSRGDLDGVLFAYHDDLIYWSNTGGSDGGPLKIVGQAAFGGFLRTILEVAESVTVLEYFRYADGVARARVECYIRHRQTGLVLTGSYRKIVTYRGYKIARVDEFHDAAKMATFWQLIAGETVGPTLVSD
jgi:ketosteroid isomerase-like protein